MSEHWKSVPILLTRLYEITDELEQRFGRRFTPDGHLMGSLGEAIAVYMYDLILLDPSANTHDAKTKDEKTLVQIKFTAGKSGYGIYSKPQHLIALRLKDRNQIEEVFNGPGEIAWKCASKTASKNAQHTMAMGRLAALMNEVKETDRIPMLRQLELRRPQVGTE
jgi:hypothetical protein